MKRTEEIFWMVYRNGGNGSTVRHATKGRALDEARRIAEMHPGCAVFALKTTAAFIADHPKVSRARLERMDPDIPF